MTSVLSVNQLSVSIDSQAILKDISFELSAGEILGLVGDSGCGKTTLLNSIAGFSPQQSGEIYLAGKVITPLTQLPPEDRHIGMIFQDYALFPHLSVSDNIAFGLTQLTKAKKTQRIEQLLTLLKLSDFSDRYPHQLSGGQQQRVAIARALAPQPDLLLFDEPFSNIDARLRQSLMLEIRQLLKKLKISAIFVTHNKDEVFTFADKMAVMYQGRILQFGEPTELCKRPNSWQVADFLQLGSWIPCQLIDKHLHTVFGQFPYVDESLTAGNAQIKMLVKPQMVSVTSEQPVNSEISYIGVTEQGYHYHLDSLLPDTTLAVKQLSFYSDKVYQLGEKLHLTILPHDYLIFN